MHLRVLQGGFVGCIAMSIFIVGPAIAQWVKVPAAAPLGPDGKPTLSAPPTEEFLLVTNGELFEFICENNRDLEQLPGSSIR